MDVWGVREEKLEAAGAHGDAELLCLEGISTE